MSEPFKHYQCHKKVEAFKILAITDYAREGDDTTNGAKLLAADPAQLKGGLYVDAIWVRKHDPQVGGYVVRYADGYLSYSPAKAFEEGYTEILE